MSPGVADAPFIDDRRLAAVLDYPSLVARIGAAFTQPIHCPPRLVIQRGPGRMLLVMVAARDGGLALVKQVTAGPGGVKAQASVIDADGRVIARLDGETLTTRRTAAASVHAASLLARPEAATLAVLGAGPQAAAQARAYIACRPLERILVWARRAEAARAFAQALDAAPAVEVVTSAGAAVARADIVTCATRAETPLVHGVDVRPGTHVDLVGGFRPTMREADDALIGRARVFADTGQALVEAGDLAGPIAARVLDAADVTLLGDWCAARRPRSDDAVTVYKSVGFAALDLVAAELALERLA